jgi:hypothetical protein
MLYAKYLSIAFIKRLYLLSYSISDTSFMSPYACTVSRKLSRVLVTYNTGFGSDDWIYCTLYIHTTRDYRQYSAIADLLTLQLTVVHTLEFLVFTSLILATDLSQSHCHFKSRIKFSFHCLFPLLPLFCSCQFRTPDSIQFLCSQAHIPAGWSLETRLSTLDYCSVASQSHIATDGQSISKSWC